MTADYTLQWEPIDALRADGVEQMLYNHWREVGIDHDAVPLDPDWERAYAMEAAGMLFSAALRNNGRLIGYNSFAVSPHLHYRSSLYAFNDIIYVDPRERGSAGIRLVRGTEKMLKELGVKKIVYHTKLHVHIGSGNGLVGDFLNRLGYTHFENCYCKLVG